MTLFYAQSRVLSFCSSYLYFYDSHSLAEKVQREGGREGGREGEH